MPIVRLRSALALASVAALCAFTVMGGAASAVGSKGVKGDPQPELKPFKIGAATGAGGNVAIESNGDLVVAYGVATKNDDGATAVCVLARGGHACSHRTIINMPSGDTAEDVPQVYVQPHDHVVVLREGNDSNPAGDDLLFTSTDGGKTFGPPVRVGNVPVDASALIGSNIVFTGPNAHVGWEVESIPVNASAGPGATATPIAQEPSAVAVADYKGGVLAAADFVGPTKVVYAAAGKNFNASSSYVKVASFAGEELLGISGNALLTLQSTDDNHVFLRYFNGTKFGAAHAVPGLKGHDLGLWTTIDKDSAGVTHVFSESEFGTPSYALEEQSTTSGTHWSSRTNLGNAIDSDFFTVNLDHIGSGLVLGTGGDAPAIGYPVLAHQRVTFTLSKSTIKKGHKVTGKGKGSAAAAGRKVELQIEKAGRWDNVASTHEKANGSFSFTIKGKHVGASKYRAVAADHAGYVEFGYSAGKTLHVKK